MFGLPIPIVSSTQLVNISHIVFVWPCWIAVCPMGDCRTESRQLLGTTSQILQRLTQEIKYLGFLHIYTSSWWKATQAVSKSVQFANPNSYYNLSSLTHLRGKWIDKSPFNFRWLLSSCAEMKSASTCIIATAHFFSCTGWQMFLTVFEIINPSSPIAKWPLSQKADKQINYLVWRTIHRCFSLQFPGLKIQ